MAHDWDRVQALFEAAQGMAPAAQTAFLDAACGSDVALRDDVTSLLRCADRGDFLEQPLARDVPRVLKSLAGLDAPPEIAGYEVQCSVASGGMGTVYRAHARGDAATTVAVKVVRRDLDPELVSRRLRNEGEVLAALHHPNIARFLDSGTTADGRPYYVMAFIDGEQLLTACDRRRLTVAARLRLFAQVCAAVEHAHRNLVIHRDLKPGNILVDAAGTPHLVDFGIAKVLAREPRGAATTGAVTQLMTPEYASPEQVRGEPATTASDIYSLGMLLFELLTGRPPYRLAGSALDMARTVTEAEVPPPSQVVTLGAPGIDCVDIAARRATTPRQLQRQLADDLDNIVLFALRKEPERRYATVAQFADDVRRHLARQPITARRDTFWYRTRKFVQRNRVAAVAAGLLAATLVVGVVGILWQAHKAREEAATAQRITSIMVEVLGSGDPDQRTNLTAREFVDRAAARLTEHSDLQPDIHAALRFALGTMYYRLGAYSPALQHLQQALELRTAGSSAEHPETAKVRIAISAALTRLGRYDDAETAAKDAIASSRRLGDQPLLAQSLEAQGIALKGLGNRQAAEALLRKGLAIRQRECRADDAQLASAMNNLATVRWGAGDLDEADHLLRGALTIHQAKGGDTPGLAQVLVNLGVLQCSRQRCDEALSLLRQGLAMRERLFDADHPLVAETLYSLGDTLMHAGSFDEGEVALRRCLAIRDKVQPQHWVTDDTRSLLGGCLLGKGDLAAAEPLLAASLAELRRKRGDAFEHTQDAFERLALLYERTGRAEQARECRNAVQR